MSNFEYLAFEGKTIVPFVKDLKITEARVYVNQTGNLCIIFNLQGKQEIIETYDKEIPEVNNAEFLKRYPRTSMAIFKQSEKMTKQLTPISIVMISAITDLLLSRTNGQYEEDIISKLDSEILEPLIVEWTEHYYE